MDLLIRYSSLGVCSGRVGDREDVIPHHNSSRSTPIMQFNLVTTPKALTCPIEYQPALDKLSGNLDWHFTPQ